MKEYKVELTYFKHHGKYYTRGSYMTTKEYMYQISDEVKDMQLSNKLPGTSGGDWIIHIEVEDSHPNGYPCLIMDNEPRKEYVKI